MIKYILCAMHCCDLGFGIKFPFPIYLHTEFPAPTSRCNSRSSVMELGAEIYKQTFTDTHALHFTDTTCSTGNALLKKNMVQNTRTLWSILSILSSIIIQPIDK